jgi:hypothetical protein
MVTVGDKIAWWSLDHMPRRKMSTKTGGGGGRRNSVPLFSRRKRTDSESTSPGN